MLPILFFAKVHAINQLLSYQMQYVFLFLFQFSYYTNSSSLISSFISVIFNG
jgi:hypothetical protein